MTSSTDVLIGDPGSQHVLIRPLSRSQPGLFDDRDGDWIDCDITVAAGAFHGTFRADLRSDEFRTFLEDLESLDGTSDGAATFSTLEGQLTLSLAGDGQGSVGVSGEAIDEPGTGNRLQFRFEIDRTSLRDVCASLQHLLTAFPVTDPAGL